MHMTAEWRNRMLNKLLKSVLDKDIAPLVICDMDDIIAPKALKMADRVEFEPTCGCPQTDFELLESIFR